jgi:hypothetical protein
MTASPHRSRTARRHAAGPTALALLLTGWAGVASAQLPSATPHPIHIRVLEANADARVQGGSPSTNFATGDLWLGLPDKVVFLHFPLRSPAPAIAAARRLAGAGSTPRS